MIDSTASRRVVESAEVVLSLAILAIGTLIALLGPDTPLPLVVEVAGVGIWTTVLPTGVLALLLSVRILSTGEADTTDRVLLAIAVFGVIASGYAVVGPYISSNPLLSVFPATVLGLLLSIYVLSSNLTRVVRSQTV